MMRFVSQMRYPVSVLFSEPKIPQSNLERNRIARTQVSVLFSEPKIPQWLTIICRAASGGCFSALQRAENSSMKQAVKPPRRHTLFQCSSASRKFLNLWGRLRRAFDPSSFSALQRAENSSILECDSNRLIRAKVSVLFSEPKIPQPADLVLDDEHGA